MTSHDILAEVADCFAGRCRECVRPRRGPGFRKSSVVTVELDIADKLNTDLDLEREGHAAGLWIPELALGSAAIGSGRGTDENSLLRVVCALCRMPRGSTEVGLAGQALTGRRHAPAVRLLCSR